MREFTFQRADDAAAALQAAGTSSASRYLGGGTNLVDLMRENIETPDTLIDVSGLPSTITVGDDRRVMIGGARTVPLVDFHRLPGERPDVETVLTEGDLITAVELPPPTPRAVSTYRKVRDRASYAFALVSVAALVQVEGGRIISARLALGGVAHKPWRAHLAEQSLVGAPMNATTFETAAAGAIADARGLRDNEFKIELAKNTVFAVLTYLGSQT